jgi:ribosome biogenesis GTPase
VECRPRGRFRLEKQTVLAGDLVEVQVDGAEGRIDKVLPRRTVLERPAIANVEQVLILFTLREPDADYPFLDRVLIHVERAGVAPVILLNKIDLLEPEAVAAFCHIYREQVGYPVYPIAALDGVGLDVVRPLLAGKLSVLAGHSGVGKSRLVRSLEPSRQDVRVGELSEKLGRGKHTTRHVELIPIASGGLLADTPGFTYLEFHDLEKRDLAEAFPEFRRYAGECRFDDCMHNKEPDCAVQAAVAAGVIAQSRYTNYTSFLKEVEALKRW